VDEEQAREALSDPRARARLERLALMGSLLREVESDRELPADFTDRVMAKVQAFEAPRRAPRRRAFPALGLAAASALALAAAVGLWLRDTTPASQPVALGEASEASASAQPNDLAAEAMEADALREAPAVSIESVDFGPTRGAIFLVSAGVTDTMVVWTLDEPVPLPSGPKR
jgi:hypothetical protein